MKKTGRKPKQLKEKPDSIIPLCPNFLGAEGKAEWKRITPDLKKKGLLAKIDRASLAAYCEAWEDFVFLLNEYNKEGATITTEKGNIVQNPTLGAKNKAAERVLKIACQFGMTPAARTKIDVKEEDKKVDAFTIFAGSKAVKRG